MSNKSFFDFDETIIKREESIIQDNSVAVGPENMVTCYEFGSSNNQLKIRWHVKDKETNVTKETGELIGQNPVAASTEDFNGIYYESSGTLRALSSSGAARLLRGTASDGSVQLNVTSLVKDVVAISDSMCMFFVRGSTLKLFSWAHDSVTPTESTVSLGTSGINKIRYYMDTNGHRVMALSDRVAVCVGVNVSDGVARLGSVVSRTTTDRDIKDAFFEGGSLLYSAQVGRNIFVYRVQSGSETAVMKDLRIADRFWSEGRNYYIAGNLDRYFIYDEDLELISLFSTFTVAQSLDVVSRARARRDGDNFFVSVSKVAEIEGADVDVARGTINVETSHSFHVFKGLPAEENVHVESIGGFSLISGSPMWYYDGDDITEYGFSEIPTISVRASDLSKQRALLDPSTAQNLYSYAMVYTWIDARGFKHYSTIARALIDLTEPISSSNTVIVDYPHIFSTRKKDVKIELYRTESSMRTPYQFARFDNVTSIGQGVYIDPA